jgi:hypothetical protein
LYNAIPYDGHRAPVPQREPLKQAADIDYFTCGYSIDELSIGKTKN